ncbi:MAG: aminoacyl-tRNA hydrolase [Candidatus Goldiibacteriota bacterium]
MKLIAGLGNKDPEYAGTRHNIGFDFLDHMAEKLKFEFDSKNKFAVSAEKTIRSEKVVFIKPLTYMNLSGKAVVFWAGKNKIPPENILVVHDDMDIEFGTAKIKIGGGAAGHNGIMDITQRLNTPEFVRLRIGVGRPRLRGKSTDHVLGRFSEEEAEEIKKLFEQLEDFVMNFVHMGYAKAAGRFKITRD